MQETVDGARSRTEAQPVPIRTAPRTIKRIREAKAEIVRLRGLAAQLEFHNGGGMPVSVLTAESRKKAQR